MDKNLSIFELAAQWHINPQFVMRFIDLCGLAANDRYEITSADAKAWLDAHGLTVGNDSEGLQ